ncbi:cytochrome o ubiquinol oxidase subunit IV [Stutzerimonas azotifigens]|uniref:Cytochrome bo(3) ubiquinol oxidase subunit 4 n=1 Tax=Stutzerimonas azotifigens TaxID=291995 RepID=A0ABR5YYS4_9GAMM|nr:cytochrome o ubiquinol oxidase subunit IV [Stutzerimonas azotifigens]MBA1273062.1 cytochrome o ubiquinol oxidase subunit IV [Stutzerimonas azotifigens]
MSNTFTDATGADHGTTGSYVIGFVLSVILTVIPFALVMFPTFSQSTTLWLVVGFAVVQVLVHLVFFLHMNGASEQRWNLVALGFSVLIIFLLVFLSLWIMFSVHHYMLAH